MSTIKWNRRQLVVALFAASASLPSAAQVVLNPGTIRGTIQVANEVVSTAYVNAWSTHGAASRSFSGSNYELTVNVPAGSTAGYSISMSANFASGLGFTFPARTVTVAENPAATEANFIVTSPGIVQGTVTVVGGGAVSSVSVSASADSSGISSNTSGGADGSFQLLVAPDAHLKIRGGAYIDGQWVSSDLKVISISAGETATVNFTVNPPPPPEFGQITGTIQMPGPQTPVGHAIWFLGPDMQGAGTVDGNFTLSEIPSGFYSVWIPETIFDNPVRYFRHPDANISPMYFIVSPDSIATVNVSSVQAFMGGAVSLHGSTSLGEVSTISFGALGSGDASGGQAWTDIDAASGAYQLIVSPGPWSPNLGLSWQNDLPPDRYLNEHLSLSDWGHTATFAAGETVTYHPTYRFGCVTIKVSILGGGALSHPRLNGNCEYRDHQTRSSGRTTSLHPHVSRTSPRVS